MRRRGFPLLIVIVLTAGLSAQQSLPSHTLLGTIADTAGKPLPGVTVELASPVSTNSVRTVVTAADGRYRIEKVLPGTYVLTVTRAGYGSAIREIEIGGGGEEFEYDVQLRPVAPGTVSPPTQPSRRVVCGMTVITPPSGIDPGIVAPKRVPPPGTAVKPTIRAIQPTLCWESSSDSPQVPPKP